MWTTIVFEHPHRVTKRQIIGVFSSYDMAALTPWPHSHFLGSELDFMQTDVESASPDRPNCSAELFQEDLDTLAHVIDAQPVAILNDTLTESDPDFLNHAEQTLAEQFPLSAGIQFRNLAHKFDSVLTLC